MSPNTIIKNNSSKRIRWNSRSIKILHMIVTRLFSGVYDQYFSCLFGLITFGKLAVVWRRCGECQRVVSPRSRYPEGRWSARPTSLWELSQTLELIFCSGGMGSWLQVTPPTKPISTLIWDHARSSESPETWSGTFWSPQSLSRVIFVHLFNKLQRWNLPTDNGTKSRDNADNHSQSVPNHPRLV